MPPFLFTNPPSLDDSNFSCGWIMDHLSWNNPMSMLITDEFQWIPPPPPMYNYWQGLQEESYLICCALPKCITATVTFTSIFMAPWLPQEGEAWHRGGICHYITSLEWGIFIIIHNNDNESELWWLCLPPWVQCFYYIWQRTMFREWKIWHKILFQCQILPLCPASLPAGLTLIGA